MLNLNTEILSDLKVPLPPMVEQQRILRLLEECGAPAEHQRGVHASLLTLKRGLLQDLLTGRVRVPVD